MEMTKKQRFTRYYQIYAEIKWIQNVVDMNAQYDYDLARDEKMHAFNFNKEEYFEFLHGKLNRLIRELKQLKIALHNEDVEIVRNLKNALWCGCSAKYQHEFMSNNQSHMI